MSHRHQSHIQGQALAATLVPSSETIPAEPALELASDANRYLDAVSDVAELGDIDVTPICKVYDDYREFGAAVSTQESSAKRLSSLRKRCEEIENIRHESIWKLADNPEQGVVSESIEVKLFRHFSDSSGRFARLLITLIEAKLSKSESLEAATKVTSFLAKKSVDDYIEIRLIAGDDPNRIDNDLSTFLVSIKEDPPREKFPFGRISKGLITLMNELRERKSVTLRDLRENQVALPRTLKLETAHASRNPTRSRVAILENLEDSLKRRAAELEKQFDQHRPAPPLDSKNLVAKASTRTAPKSKWSHSVERVTRFVRRRIRFLSSYWPVALFSMLATALVSTSIDDSLIYFVGGCLAGLISTVEFAFIAKWLFNLEKPVKRYVPPSDVSYEDFVSASIGAHQRKRA